MHRSHGSLLKHNVADYFAFYLSHELGKQDIIGTQSLNAAYDKLINGYQKAIGKYCPLRPLKTNNADPWLTGKIKHLRNRKDKLHAKIPSAQNPIEAISKYKAARTKLNHSIREAKTDYYRKASESGRDIFTKFRVLLNLPS